MNPIARFAATLILAMAVASLITAGEQSNKPVDFERHIMGLFSKMGCNAGSCHGSFQGKNGFRLSLFGYDADRDYAALTRDNLGRRINPVDPDHSLLLMKATGQALHEGGARFAKDSWQYRAFRDWIEAGAPRQRGSGDVTKLEITPAEYAFNKPGEHGELKVFATFADGGSEDVTAYCDFRVQDDTIAEVNVAGEVTAVRPGDTAIVALYRGKVQAIRVLVPLDSAAGFQYPKVAESNYVDRHVNAKLRRLNMVPSDNAGDLEFLRRVTIDTIGSLPTPDEVRSFLADKRADKRERKIDELLKHSLHAALWATKFSDITGNNTDTLEIPQPRRPKLSQMWHDWFAKRFRDNVPYDEIVRGVLTATSRDGLAPKEWIDQVNKYDEELAKGFCASYASKPTLDLFWRRQQQVPVEQWGEKVAAAFLGVRLECAQCHKHPTDRWTQNDYWGFANIFCAVAYPNNAFSSPDLKKMADQINTERRGGMQTKGNTNQIVLLREMYLSKPGAKPNPETGKVAPPKSLGGPEIPLSPTNDMRAELFKWMSSSENPYFARSFVNRVWAHYFGLGIVEPADDFSLANPPTNAPLLDALAKDFVEHKYDIRHIERTILLSRAYQHTSKTNETNKFDRRNFSHAQIRPMMAEVVVDVLNAALGTNETFANDAPAGAKMVEVGASRLANGNLNYVLRIFGRPPRTTACDCERAMDPALPQTLYRMTDQAILQKLRQKSNRVQQLLASKKNDEEMCEELFLATLTRLPSASEKAAFLKHREDESNREAAFIDALWALINTREFILNH
jgi:hypothetical protein